MNKIKLVGIDLAKNCYQVCALDEHGKVLYNRKYTAKKFAEAIHQLEPTTVAPGGLRVVALLGPTITSAGTSRATGAAATCQSVSACTQER